MPDRDDSMREEEKQSAVNSFYGWMKERIEKLRTSSRSYNDLLSLSIDVEEQIARIEDM